MTQLVYADEPQYMPVAKWHVLFCEFMAAYMETIPFMHVEFALESTARNISIKIAAVKSFETTIFIYILRASFFNTNLHVWKE